MELWGTIGGLAGMLVGGAVVPFAGGFVGRTAGTMIGETLGAKFGDNLETSQALRLGVRSGVAAAIFASGGFFLGKAAETTVIAKLAANRVANANTTLFGDRALGVLQRDLLDYESKFAKAVGTNLIGGTGIGLTNVGATRTLALSNGTWIGGPCDRLAAKVGGTSDGFLFQPDPMSGPVRSRYAGLARLICTMWTNFGHPEVSGKAPPIPLSSQLNTLEGASSVTAENYNKTLIGLSNDLNSFVTREQDVAGVFDRSRGDLELAKDNIVELVKRINVAVTTGTGTTDGFLTQIQEAVEAAHTILSDAIAKQEEARKGIDQNTPRRTVQPTR